MQRDRTPRPPPNIQQNQQDTRLSWRAYKLIPSLKMVPCATSRSRMQCDPAASWWNLGGFTGDRQVPHPLCIVPVPQTLPPPPPAEGYKCCFAACAL